MGSGDNTTAHAASDYESEVARTIPFHDEILRTAIDVALAAKPSPARWLDTGAGPGKLVALAQSLSPRTHFVIADPSAAMLALARAKLGEGDGDGIRYVQSTSENLPEMPGFDVITAIQCHHYGDVAARERAVARCRDLLAPGGAFITFENVRAETEEAHAIQRARIAAFQKRAGRTDEEVAKHFAREGTAFFPIKPSEHLALLSRVFASGASGSQKRPRAEMIWRMYGQAGFLVV